MTTTGGGASSGVDRTHAPGLLLVRGTLEEVRAWAARSVVPVATVRLDATWTAVAPTGPAEVSAPYQDGTLLLAGRPVTGRLTPALGFFEVDDRAVLTLHPEGRRREMRWVVYDPEVGLLHPPGLDLAGPGEIVTAAGAPRAARETLVDLLHERELSPRRMLAAVLGTLGLPGTDLVRSSTAVLELEGVVIHQPSAREVDFFEDAVKDSVRLRRELGSLS